MQTIKKLHKKRIVLFMCFLFIYLPGLISQENKERKALDYTEIIREIERKDIPFTTKYELPVKHLTITEQINIYKLLVSFAKNETDKSSLVRLYCSIYTLSNTLNKKPDDYKVYLDSALVYEKEVEEKKALGELYNTICSYYFERQDDTTAHEYCRKTLDVCQNEKGTELIILKALYNIAVVYLLRLDAKSMKECIDQMLEITDKVDTPEAILLTFPVISAYYRVHVNDPAIDDDMYYSYLDSVYQYSKKTVDVYESANEQLKAAYIDKASTFYNNLLEVASIRQDPDFVSIIEWIDKASKFVPVTDTVLIHRNYHAKGRALYNQKKYDEAFATTFEALEIIENYSEKLEAAFYDTYTILVDLYIKKEDYRNALKYEQLRNDVIKKLYESERYETIKDLEARYQTAEKELEINKLNEQQQQLKYDRTIILAFSILVMIVLLLGLLYNRIKRLKKEKETIQLANTIEQKEKDYEILLKESQQKITGQYIAGLESERSRLAKELHDGIANDLLGIIMQLRSNGEQQIINDKLEQAYKDVRNISHRLIPPILTDVTLADVLEDFVRKQNSISLANVVLDISFDQDWHSLPANYALEAYRIIQEAVSNAIKHSNASMICIQASFADNILYGCVKDNGKGFDIHSKANGIGLKTMKERAKHMKAILEISSEKGEETKVSFQLDTLSSFE